MAYEKYMEMKNAAIPADIAADLGKCSAFARENTGKTGGGTRAENSVAGDAPSAPITLTAFEDKNDVLKNPKLRREAGFAKMPDGNYIVSMFCPMPDVTAEMIDWWFWWHPQEKERYKLWFPGEHFNISVSKKDADYFSAEKFPGFKPNSQFPTEKIGGIRMPLRIDFVNPEDFGFHETLMKKSRVKTVICGHVGAFGGIVSHTEMSHIFFEDGDGLFMTSRFWIGKTLKNPLIRKIILTDETAFGMAAHCCVEYRNLAAKLPELFAEYAK